MSQPAEIKWWNWAVVIYLADGRSITWSRERRPEWTETHVELTNDEVRQYRPLAVKAIAEGLFVALPPDQPPPVVEADSPLELHRNEVRERIDRGVRRTDGFKLPQEDR